MSSQTANMTLSKLDPGFRVFGFNLHPKTYIGDFYDLHTILYFLLCHVRILDPSTRTWCVDKDVHHKSSLCCNVSWTLRRCRGDKSVRTAPAPLRAFRYVGTTSGQRLVLHTQNPGCILRGQHVVSIYWSSPSATMT